MAYEKDRLALLLELLEFAVALCLEEHVSNAECFVNYKYLGIYVDGNRKCKTDEHTARIGLAGLVHIVADIGKGKNVVDLLIDLILGKAHHGTVQIDILDTVIIHVETRTEFEQCGDPSVHLDLTRCGSKDTRKDLEKCGLARSVCSDDADGLALLYFEVDTLQGIVELEAFLLSGKPECVKHTVAVTLVELVSFFNFRRPYGKFF